MNNEEKILNCLKKVGQATSITRLANKLKIDKRNLTNYLSQLEKENLIVKRTSETDKRVKLISLQKSLFFFRFRQKFLFHPRTIIKKKHFKMFEKKIEILSFPLTEYYSYGYKFRFPEEDEDEDDIKWGSGFTPNPEPEIKYERAFLFDKTELKELEILGYSNHIYSPKEIRDLRQKKRERHKKYALIKRGKKSVKLLLIGTQVPTPFIYLDYFILRKNGMLEVENKVKINENGKREVIKRDFELKLKGFDYYCYSYDFVYSKDINYGKNNAQQEEEQKIRQENYNEWMAEVDKIIEEKEIESMEEEKGKNYKWVIQWEYFFYFINDIFYFEKEAIEKEELRKRGKFPLF
ncbi:hypothetical protein ES702_05212 [subsurface metagenome]